MKRSFAFTFLLFLIVGALFYLSFRHVDLMRWLGQQIGGEGEKAGPAPQPRVVRSGKEVPYRDNPSVPVWAGVAERQRELVQVFALGGKLGRDEFFFIRPSDVDIDQAGNVYVVDRGHRRLQVFAPDGSLLRSLRYDKQNNPYFLSPRKVAVSAAGDICVWDEQKGLVRFDARGRFLRRQRLPYKVADLVVDSRGRVIVLAPGEPLMLHKLAADGRELLAFGEHVEPDTALWSAFGLGTLAVDPGDTLYFSLAYPYRITAFDPGGRALWSFGRELGVLITPPTISRDPSGRVRSVLRQQISFGVAVGGDGLIYNLVRTRASPGADRIDVFSPQGEYLQIFYLAVPAVAMAMRGSRLVILQAPPDQRVICYDIVALGAEGRTLLGWVGREKL
jgi:sugar lactone lactonase YvrE